ncbi:MlaD family protein [Thiohalorhabdus sp.]|uniref:MlaD family protein n=1 Tax=Thiohalorhabdus sp. TaxID=3094134 RepID=UPI002FC3D762
MERDVRYLTVGLVVVLLMAAFAGFAVWQAGTYRTSDRDRYTVPFEGGVGGLSQGGRVRYRGVEVGRVLEVRVSPQKPDVVAVDVAVEPITPVTEDTVAQIKPQGITGLSYIELTTEAAGPPPPKPEDRPYPVLEARSSQLDRLIEDLPETAERVTRIAERLERVLSEDNLAEIGRTLANARKLSGRLNRLAERAGGLVAKAEGSLEEVGRTAGQARTTLSEGRELIPDVEAALTRVRSLSTRLDRLTRSNADQIDRFAGEGLEEIRLFLRDGRSTLAEIKALARQLRNNPSQLVVPPEKGGLEVPQ